MLAHPIGTTLIIFSEKKKTPPYTKTVLMLVTVSDSYRPASLNVSIQCEDAADATGLPSSNRKLTNEGPSGWWSNCLPYHKPPPPLRKRTDARFVVAFQPCRVAHSVPI